MSSYDCLTKQDFFKYLELEIWNKKTALYLASLIHPKKKNLSITESGGKKRWNSRITQAIKKSNWSLML